jgi:hypothetical protein
MQFVRFFGMHLLVLHSGLEILNYMLELWSLDSMLYSYPDTLSDAIVFGTLLAENLGVFLAFPILKTKEKILQFRNAMPSGDSFLHSTLITPLGHGLASSWWPLQISMFGWFPSEFGLI